MSVTTLGSPLGLDSDFVSGFVSGLGSDVDSVTMVSAAATVSAITISGSFSCASVLPLGFSSNHSSSPAASTPNAIYIQRL